MIYLLLLQYISLTRYYTKNKFIFKPYVIENNVNRRIFNNSRLDYLKLFIFSFSYFLTDYDSNL